MIICCSGWLKASTDMQVRVRVRVRVRVAADVRARVTPMSRPSVCWGAAAPPPKRFLTLQQVTLHVLFATCSRPLSRVTVRRAASIAEAGVKERADVGVAVDLAADRLCAPHTLHLTPHTCTSTSTSTCTCSARAELCDAR